MAKLYGSRVCGIFTIILLIFNFKQSVPTSVNSNLEHYDTSSSYLPQVKVDDLVKIRERRDATTDPKNEYQAVASGDIPATTTGANNATTSNAVNTLTNAAGNGGTEASVTVSYNVHNVGVNGTGQRKDYSGSNSGTTLKDSNDDTHINVGAATDGKKPLQVQYPKKTVATTNGSPAGTSVNAAADKIGNVNGTANGVITTTEQPLIDEVDVDEEQTNQELGKNNLTRQEDHHVYYNSVMVVNKAEAANIWNEIKNITHNAMLSQSHRRAMTVELKFDFPFYGHYVRNITVATGGFLYTGEYVHSWLAATQYIAPLMANFDTTLSNDSFVRLQDNGTAFTVVWENVVLQDKSSYGKFTFSVTLHKNGDIVFAYFSVPIAINAIQDTLHPVKVGLSDAYILDKFVYFARRKTIYEYHRVTFTNNDITNSTIIYLTALPTCLGYNDCVSCINHNTTFECVWCPLLNRCSTGTDRRKHEWMAKNCDRTQIKDAARCPAIGKTGNNAGAANNDYGTSDSIPFAPGNNGNMNATTPTPNNSGSSSTVEITPTAAAKASAIPAEHEHKAAESQEFEHSAAGNETKNVGVAFGFLVPICFVFIISMWLFYAYRNPHTRSGQLLIQFRPSQWSWRRGEARYTAATIHM